MVRRTLVLAAAAALCGCTVVGPHYHVPDAAMVDAEARRRLAIARDATEG